LEHLTEYIVERAIRAQEDDTFDTHDICFTLMNDFAADYVRELYACLEGDEDPFVKLHTKVEKLLASSYLSHVVRKLDSKRQSMNCRGKEEQCQVWEKTV
jgi:hypothetical protein